MIISLVQLFGDTIKIQFMLGVILKWIKTVKMIVEIEKADSVFYRSVFKGEDSIV